MGTLHQRSDKSPHTHTTKIMGDDDDDDDDDPTPMNLDRNNGYNLLHPPSLQIRSTDTPPQQLSPCNNWIETSSADTTTHHGGEISYAAAAAAAG